MPRWLVQQIAQEWRWGVVALGMAAVVGGSALAIDVSQRRYAESGPGEMRGAHLAAGADGRPVLVVAEYVGADRITKGGIKQARLELVDPSDGHRRAVALVTEPTQCVSGGPGLLWCAAAQSGSTLELRDAATLAVRVTHATLVAAAPPLAPSTGYQAVNGWHAAPSTWIDPRTNEAWMPTEDGRFWHVDPKTLRGGVADQAVPPAQAVDITAEPTALAVGITTPLGSLGFSGSPRATLALYDGGAERTPMAPENTYLGAASFIGDRSASTEGSPLTLDSGKLLLVAHEETVDHNTARILISAVTRDGKRRWTTTLEAGEIVAAWVVDFKLVLAIRSRPQGSLVTLDQSDGRILWRHDT